MSLNFNFLKNANEDLYRLATKIEENRIICPEAALYMGSTFLDNMVYDICKRTNHPYNSVKSIERVNELSNNGIISYQLADHMVKGFKVRNYIHNVMESVDQYFINNKRNSTIIYKLIYRASIEYYQEFIDKDFTQSFTDPELLKEAFVNYPYCPVCGKKTKEKALLCSHCEDEIDLLNNLMEIVETVGIDNNFKKEQLMGVNFYSADVEVLILNLRNRRLITKSGIFYSFNRKEIDEFKSRIDDYKEIRDIILKIETQDINPVEIKKSETYMKGSQNQEPFTTFYNMIYQQLSNSFRETLQSEDYVVTIRHGSIFTPEEFTAWCRNNLDDENLLGQLKRHYLEAKRNCKSDDCIMEAMHIDSETLEFLNNSEDVCNEILKIKKEKYIAELVKFKTFKNALESSGLSEDEVNELRKHDPDFRKRIEAQIERRKERFLTELKSNGLKDSFIKSRLEREHLESEMSRKRKTGFYRKTIGLLQERFLSMRKSGKTERECIGLVQIDDDMYGTWLNNPNFKTELSNVELKILFDLLEKGSNLREALKLANITKKEFNSLIVNAYDSQRKHITDLYEKKVLPEEISNYMNLFKTRREKDALKKSKFDRNILYIALESNEELSESYLEMKKAKYINASAKNLSHSKALKESDLTEIEFEKHRDELTRDGEEMKMKTVLMTLADGNNTTKAAKKAGVKVNAIYEWYYEGTNGNEKYRKFAEEFKKIYIKPRITGLISDDDFLEFVQEVDMNPMDFLVKTERITKKDAKCWKNYQIRKFGGECCI